MGENWEDIDAVLLASPLISTEEKGHDHNGLVLRIHLETGKICLG
jgi:hypothetical protein